MSEAMKEQNKNLEEDKLKIKQQETFGEIVKGLAEFGGFGFLESAISGLANMNSDREARKRIFLNDEKKEKERRSLLKVLELWIEVLESGQDVAAMLELCRSKGAASDEVLRKNQLNAVKEVRDLERSYRSVKLFFDNAGSDKLRNITFVNANIKQLTDLDNPIYLKAIGAELKSNYDRLDLRDNYSILVIPGYLESNVILKEWMKICEENKTSLVTDFMDLSDKEDVVDLFMSANLTGGELYRSKAMMCCNWPVGRRRYAELGETEDLRIPPSTGLAGYMYKQKISQVVAGKTHGSISGVDGVAFPLLKSEISILGNLGLIPFVYEYSQVMAFSERTLYSGDDIGWKTYSVVRTFDHTFKVLCDFVNRRAFENWDTASEKKQRQIIVSYLDSIKGPGKEIEDYEIQAFRQDPVTKHIYLFFALKAFFPGKTYVIKMDGMKVDDKVEWKAEYLEQE